MNIRTRGKWMGSTAWMLVHPIKGPWYRSIDFREDRPGGFLVNISQWRWHRVLVTPDHADAATTDNSGSGAKR